MLCRLPSLVQALRAASKRCSNTAYISDAPPLLPGTLPLPATACATLHLAMVQLISAKLSGSPPHRPAMGKQLAARVTSLEKSKVEHGYQNIEVCWHLRCCDTAPHACVSRL